MPLSNFNGNTLVAFIDISGFKELMKNNEKALNTLNKFYQAGYNSLLPPNNNNIEGLFISDCGILFVKNTNLPEHMKLEKLLEVIKSINEAVLQDDILLTTSIAFGYFSYQQKIEFEGIEKNQLHGYAYVNAFLDNEVGKPKIQPGQCRILKNDLPENFSNNNPFIREKGKHYYFYWNVKDSNRIDEFLSDYNDSYNLKYMGIRNSLKKYR